MKIGDLIKLKDSYSFKSSQFTGFNSNITGIIISSYIVNHMDYYNVLCNDNLIRVFTTTQLQVYYELINAS
jgi:hypothetical protein